MGRAIKLKEVNRVVLIDSELITPNAAQPRTVFGIKELESLAESIISNGLLQPLTVRRVDAHFELISGERRLRACKLADIKKVPCIIVETTNQQAAVFALLENLQRCDLNFFEEALAIKGLITEWGISQTDLGKRLGKAQSTIANKIRLLRFDDAVQRFMLTNGINERQARALLKVETESKLYEAIEYISANSLSAAQTEKYVAAIDKCQKPQRKTPKILVKDVRIFLNTINNAIKIMNQSGIHASAQKIDSGDFIEYVVKIPLAN